MNRRNFLQSAGAAALLPYLPRAAFARRPFSRPRPGEPGWPPPAAWRRLRDAVDGNLIRVEFPLGACIHDVKAAACQALIANIKNPYYIRDHVGLTQTLGWVDAWWTKPSAYAVAAENAAHIAAAIDFAREHRLRLVIKGTGHSYQGTSNAPDSLLVWTRRMDGVEMREAFVPRGCENSARPRRAVTIGGGAIWMQAYEAVTTRHGGYVQGGGCTTVGVAGLVQSGGFGSFSKRYGTAAAGLLEAEVVTADGRIRTANACQNPDLFWALKGGGGGTFGVVSQVTLAVRDLPEFFGAAIFTVKAASDGAFRDLLRRFVAIYRESLFNDHWGEHAIIGHDNMLMFSMVCQGLGEEEVRKTWQPFLAWIAGSPGSYSIPAPPVLVSMPARAWWDVEWHKQHHLKVFDTDSRPGASPNNVWWTGDGGQVAWTIYGYESLWLPAALLADEARLADAFFAASRFEDFELHFNKGLAGAPREALEAGKDTATNPAVLSAFALMIVGDAGGGYPGVRGHEPDAAAARRARANVHRCANVLRRLAPGGGAYVSESNYFQEGFQHAYWGSHYPRLAAIKKRYDPEGLFFVHNGVGSESWSRDGFTRKA